MSMKVKTVNAAPKPTMHKPSSKLVDIGSFKFDLFDIEVKAVIKKDERGTRSTLVQVTFISPKPVVLTTLQMSYINDLANNLVRAKMRGEGDNYY